ncbi:MAG TPA: YncE family protein [Pyrinomonadaceae bacterium]|nr:YncE family protein [Pyrinomonadaceae bacterium]
MTHKILAILLLLAAGQFTHVFAQQVFTEQGVSIDFSVASKPIAGEEAAVRFKITSANDGVPLSNLRPVAWIDRRESAQVSTTRQCRDKVQQFLQSSFTKRPTLDLNAYFVLALNNEANISVIDPISGFGGSKLYTLIPLKTPGEDWVITDNNKRVYVSMPQSNQIAVVDVPTWNVVANIDAGVKPTRVALQHDQRYLWVGTNDGVTVIDTVTAKQVAQIKTGAGPHEIVFNDDDSIAFVTNKAAGTVTLIDIRKLAAVSELKAGSKPIAVVFSSLSKSAYVANEDDGTIFAIGGPKRDVIAQIKTSRHTHAQHHARRPLRSRHQHGQEPRLHFRSFFESRGSHGAGWSRLGSDQLHEEFRLRSFSQYRIRDADQHRGPGERSARDEFSRGTKSAG